MSVASQRLMDNITYEDLYRRWEQGNWSAYDIDMSKDRGGWQGLSEIRGRAGLGFSPFFFSGGAGAPTPPPPSAPAAPTEEMSYFLATQQVDEVRHSIFFHRFFKEV